jgi:hypothetical protein
MALPVRRSILVQFSMVFGCVSLCAWLLAAQALAQHPGARVGGAAPVTSPPIYHPPLYRAPIYQPPVYQAPIYRAPRYGMIAAPPIRSFSTIPVRPPGPIRPFPLNYRFIILPIFSNPFFPFDYCWWATCGPFWTSALIYNGVTIGSWNPPNYVVAPASEPPAYVYGMEGRDVPQLFLQDGAILNVSDYWVVDGQLHFLMIEQEGVKPVEQVIPFGELDLQKTIDVNTQRGFRFLLRNEPFEQYVRDHPDGPPPALSPEPK